MSITASEARKNLFPLIEKVNDDRTPIEITAHLLRVPANAKRLVESLQQALSGQRQEHDLAR